MSIQQAYQREMEFYRGLVAMRDRTVISAENLVLYHGNETEQTTTNDNILVTCPGVVVTIQALGHQYLC
jgi:hypothetical protein